MYIIIKLLSYYYYFIIIFFPHERRGLHDPILVLINLISSSSSSIKTTSLDYNHSYILFYFFNIKMSIVISSSSTRNLYEVREIYLCISSVKTSLPPPPPPLYTSLHRHMISQVIISHGFVLHFYHINININYII